MATTIAVPGITGRMGRALAAGIFAQAGVQLAAATARPDNPLLDTDVGPLVGLEPQDVPIQSQLPDTPNLFDVLIDFTTPEATLAHIFWCKARGVAMVIGTTGLSPDHQQAIQEASTTIPIVYSANMSVGTNLVFNLLEIAARTLGGSCDMEIVEAHHRYKKDAPSGTALHMGSILARTMGRDLNRCRRPSDATGPREQGTIGFSSIRGGDLAGEHQVLFIGEGEQVEIGVRATSRATYARGAIQAGCWLAGKKPGLFDMKDVLGLD
ncbi:MAG: 4-hydroxy-tetrahydrodipicolinate reductase [Kistimonas sp.]|nr:4-hydroxy-tetrahydrodipicolinate reductase [Kistimonas sp.]